MKIEFTLNNALKTIEVEPDEMLLDTLHRLNLYSVRRGCDTTSCGVCTVLLDDKPVPSCSFLSVRLDNRSVTTVEGIQEDASDLADYFGSEGADQCGYCNSGIALSVHAMKQLNKPLDEETIKHYLTGHLCRCTGYQSQLKAIKAYLDGDKHV
jgi:carbon-monoxide dehydrogenase small subunit